MVSPAPMFLLLVTPDGRLDSFFIGRRFLVKQKCLGCGRYDESIDPEAGDG